MAPSISVKEYYAGKSIFITGSTGFMGKVLVEKILRSCADVKVLYLLMRSKRGHSSKERIDEFVNSPIFEYIKKEHPEQLQKLRVVPGDILQEDLGISKEDRQMLQKECQIAFHCAACVRFDMFIKDAVNLNTVGTKMVLELVAGMPQLEVLVHVSTAYSRCDLAVLEEKLYPSSQRPQDVIDCVSWMDNELLEHMQPKIIQPQPNTYAYTKSLTEDLVAQYAGKFPIVIARPSIVTAALKEPMPGWVDNLNGPTGMMVGAGKGVIRTMHMDDHLRADVIPVDLVVNACILLAYKTALEKPKDVYVCNITQSEVNPISWGEALDLGRKHLSEFPFSVCLWYPGGAPQTYWLMHQITLFLTHFLPAYFIDLLMILTGKKPFMVKIQKKVNYGLQVLQYYTTKEWYFKNDNLVALKKEVSVKDNEIFYTDSKIIDWDQYIRYYIKGAREYCLKEDPSTLPQARKLHKQLYYLDRTFQLVLYALLVYIIYYYVNMLFKI